MKTTVISCFLAICFFSFYSCKKEKITDTVHDVVHDTVCVQPTKGEILTQKTWQIDELYRCYQNTNTHYVRGGVNTTGVDYSNLRLTFVNGGTGTYIDEVNTSHTLSWNFLDSDFRNANLAIGAPYATSFIWNLVEINDKYLHTTSIASVSGDALMLTARYIQVP